MEKRHTIISQKREYMDSKLEEDWRKRLSFIYKPEAQNFTRETHLDGRRELIPASCLSGTQQST